MKLSTTEVKIWNNFLQRFEELFDKDKSFSIHHQNLQVLATEMNQVFLMLPQTLWYIWKKKSKKNEIWCNLRNNFHFIPRNIKYVYHGSDTISYYAPKTWNIKNQRILQASEFCFGSPKVAHVNYVKSSCLK